MRIAIAGAVLVMLAGCTSKRPPASTPVAAIPARPQQREFVDLHPGMRLQIIAPITLDGTARILADRPAESDEANRTVTVKASSNMVGYETAFWEVDARPGGGGIHLRLASALMTKDGIPAPISAPTKALLHVTRQARFIRVFYLIRKSESDHEMAVAGVDRADRMEPFTTALKTSPAETCHNSSHIYCEWIPYGMAVRPERKKSDNWAPVN